MVQKTIYMSPVIPQSAATGSTAASATSVQASSTTSGQTASVASQTNSNYNNAAANSLKSGPKMTRTTRRKTL